MKKLTFTKSAVPAFVLACVCLAGGTFNATAQLTPEQANLVRDFFGNRAEAAIILSGSDNIGGGTFTVEPKNNDDIEFSLFKFGGNGELGEPRTLGNSSVRWSPFVKGVIGYASGDNEITFGTLAGNDLEESTLALQFGGGVTFYMTENFRITPSVGVIYGHYESELDDSTPAGAAARPFLDLSLDSIGSTPGVNVAYRIPLRGVTFDLSSQYTLYATSDISDEDDSQGIKANGTTHAWENKVDVDIPLPWELWGSRLHTGGFVSHTALFGDLTDSINTDNFFTIHPRLVLNTLGRLWKVAHIGLGGSYFVGENLTGYDFGVDVSFKF
ncbi:MAG: autotransporter outer membrane beta-barrel domain-containing protein [Verrucomicrobia subdivision 3 bacterium]|nr:autotransporter outer membrane beta-barrel domain-containing protein [Limisphaerales bacterium]